MEFMQIGVDHVIKRSWGSHSDRELEKTWIRLGNELDLSWTGSQNSYM